MHMGLLHHDISVLDFDHIYKQQGELLRSFTPKRIIDLSDIEGKNLYCNLQAEEAIKRRLNEAHWKPGITFIGSGNFHYGTYLMLQDIHESFTLCLFDHHTDMFNVDGYLSCGSWVLLALENLETMKHIIIIGPPMSEFNNLPLKWRERITFIAEEEGIKDQLLDSFIPTEHTYISIDKDILSWHDARTRWSQGSVPLSVLTETIDYLIQTTQVIGIDICGEWSYLPSEAYFPKNQIYIRKNEKANLEILNTIKKWIPSPHLSV